ncbi:unnamed protein product [Ambrosiozyma monospora]|uniref:Unnamed protein product n=1 Tax=Ambrosiozyma monospora TaxID=43982 RepID=A0ACB5TSX5_AMBMO|nr:unnamed protein product [Ambrosiozyma monospora]
MSSTIIASGIPLTTTDDKVQDFFSFCCKIKKLDTLDKTEKTKSVAVEFASASAVSTALLLNGAELDGAKIKVIEEGLSKQPTIATADVKTATTTAPNSAESATHDGVPSSDIPQEYKPKATIAAEYLAHGYVLGDQFLKKAVAYDQEKGYSTKFKSFLNNLDSKYQLQAKNREITEKYQVKSKVAQVFTLLLPHLLMTLTLKPRDWLL